jgi:hypothetical protein
MEFEDVEMTDEDQSNVTGSLSFRALLKSPAQGLDANLKLALEAELDRIGRRNHRAKFEALHDKWDEAGDGDDDLESAEEGRDRAVYQGVKAILSLPLDTADLEAVESIDWGHGTDMIYWIDREWGGVDDFFEIGSLNGLEACKNLRSLDVVWQKFTDITPLAHLTKLESACFEYPKFQSLEPLLQLPALKELVLMSWSGDETQASETLQCLRDRGVDIRL